MGLYFSFLWRVNPDEVKDVNGVSDTRPAEAAGGVGLHSSGAGASPEPPAAYPFRARAGSAAGREAPGTPLPQTDGAASAAASGPAGGGDIYLWRKNPKAIVACAAGFMLTKELLKLLLRRVVPVLGMLPAEKQRQIAEYTVALLHHLVAAPWSVYRLWRDFKEQQRGPQHRVDYAPNEQLFEFVCGYFVYDFLNSLRNIRMAPDFFIHHLAGLIVLSALQRGPVLRWIPHILASELSTILLNVMWYMRQLGMAGSQPYTAIGLAFVAVFTAMRVVHLPAALLTVFVRHPGDLRGFGWTKWTLPLVIALQYYWYAKIMRQFAPVIRKLLRVGV